MRPKLVTKSLHAYLDYPVALALIGFPFVLRLGQTQPIALWLSVGTGIAALVLTLFTDHKLGVVRVLPYSLHLTVDFIVGVAFLTAPLVLAFKGIDALYYLANGAAVVAVVSLHRADPSPVPVLA